MFFQNPTPVGFWLLLISSLAFPLTAVSDNCISNHIDQHSIVSHVYDGDTIKLRNGKKIRLIGVDTPEMNYKTGQAEPYAVKAKAFLKKRILRKRVGLRYGTDKKDRYGRYLAHVFYKKQNLQQALILNGLGFNITFPPNLWALDCYAEAEKIARKQQKGLWKKHDKNIIDAQAITSNQTGFQFIKGHVQSINKGRKSIRLKLNDHVSIQINKKNWPYFSRAMIQQLKNQQVVARGWINQYKNHYYLTINHPNALKLQ